MSEIREAIDALGTFLLILSIVVGVVAFMVLVVLVFIATKS